MIVVWACRSGTFYTINAISEPVILNINALWLRSFTIMLDSKWGSRSSLFCDVLSNIKCDRSLPCFGWSTVCLRGCGVYCCDAWGVCLMVTIGLCCRFFFLGSSLSGVVYRSRFLSTLFFGDVIVVGSGSSYVSSYFLTTYGVCTQNPWVLNSFTSWIFD
jgi:hypothetical protein